MHVRLLLSTLCIYGFNTFLAQTFSCGSTIIYQEHSYKTVEIGNQCWFAENLMATMNKMGEEIAIKQGKDEWVESKVEPAISFPSDAYREEYGVLYNYNAVVSDDICPTG
jgi:uncharacterized protein (TIGR02145 family)